MYRALQKKWRRKENSMASDPTKPVALITGGTSGIGLATAKLLHEKGYAVVCVGTNPDRIVAAKRELPPDVVVLQADVRSVEESARVAAEVRDRFGRVDFLHLSAGISRMLPIEEVDEAFFDEHYDVTVRGQFFMLQQVLPLLQKGSSVLFTSAVGAERGFSGYAVASSTKGATAALVPSLAVELAPRGIRVNGIRPGAIDTSAWDKLGLPPQLLAVFRESIGERVPAGRMGRAEEIAEVAAFLASGQASYITGTVVDVDGGHLHAF
jgi:NAD(P)-dependent dehydrogenase (short-subunit alcohol dehydrogenase family)